MARPDTSARDHSAALRMALATSAFYLVLGLILAFANGGNAEWFVKLGTNDPAMVQHARDLLGHEDVVVPFIDHHDGPNFWLLARDPLLLHPEESQPYLDGAPYRAQRIWYPLVASPFHLGGEQALLWGLFVMNVVAVGVGTYFTYRLARELLAPPKAGLAFALNPLVLVGVLLDLGDVWALTALVAAVYFVRRDRWWWAVAACSVTVLSREVMLAGVIGLAIGAVGRPVWARVRLALIPTIAMGAWLLYVRSRFPGPNKEIVAFNPVPFGAWIETYRFSWAAFGRWGDFLVALVVALIGVVVIVRFVKRRTLELWTAVPFSLLLPFVSGQVLSNSTNSTRLIGPSLTLLVLDVYANRREVPVRWPQLPWQGARPALGRSA